MGVVLTGVGYGVVDAVRRSTNPSGAILRDFTFGLRNEKLQDGLYNTTRRSDWKRFVDRNVIHLILIY